MHWIIQVFKLSMVCRILFNLFLFLIINPSINIKGFISTLQREEKNIAFSFFFPMENAQEFPDEVNNN